LSLDFLQPFLDSRITFSRGSNATLVDATGKITYAPNNQLTYSQDFTNAAWSNANTPIRTSGQIDPDGGTTATKLELDVNDGIYNFVGSKTGSYVFSIWVKGDVAGTIRLSDASSAAFNINVAVTTAWTRVDTGSRAVSGNFSPYIYRDTGNLATVYVAFAQLEQVTYQTTPSTYVATTASAYYGPRFDYDPVTLAPKGLLIEEARTNLLTYSQDWTNAAWAKTNITVTAAATASPDGTVNAQRLQAIAAVPTVINNVPVAVAATSATYSIYVKQGTGPNTANVFLFRNNTTATLLVGGSLNYATGAWSYSTGSTGVTVSNAGNGWWRIQMTATTGITSGDALHGYVGWTGASAAVGDFMYAYGAQIEAGSFATSYIPTVASTVTRSADVATMTGTNFSSWFNPVEGTLVANFVPTNSIANNTRAAAISDGVNRIVDIYIDTTVWRSFNGTTNVTPASSTAVLNSSVSFASAYKSGDYAASMNGSAVGTAATAGVQSANKLNIGSNIANSNQLNGHIRAIAYYNTRLPNAQLQTLTAPSLATTLTMSFTDQAYTVGV
jgi:hypothetical protein